MLARVARAALFLATMLVATTLARPAFAAAAPFCDDRGATALAGPPDLQAPDDSIQRARAQACGHGVDGDAWRAMLRAPRGHAVVTPDDPSPAWPTIGLPWAPAESSELRATGVAGGPTPGAGARVERPPRP